MSGFYGMGEIGPCLLTGGIALTGKGRAGASGGRDAQTI